MKDGTRYEGEWKLDAKHGKGEIIFPNGVKICTHWDDGKMHGEGVIINSDGKRQRATYHHNLEIKLSE
jgi:hypothetical protein